MKYYAPVPKRYVTAQALFTKQIQPEYFNPRAKHTSMNDWRYDRDLYRAEFPSKRIRLALGFVRAMGAQNFFKGSNTGAEND